MIKIITIQGPTGVGKTELSIKLAKALNTEIISADSRQVYKKMNIGTAKPSQELLDQVHHHMIDIVNPDEEYSAGQFKEDADKIIKKMNEQGKIPIIVGGTGFYIKTLIYGISEMPSIPAETRIKWKKKVEKYGNAEMYQKLEKVDPKFAKKIHPNDTQRLIRGLEIHDYTGKSITHFWENQNKKKYYDDFNILVKRDRDDLYDRINKRTDIMIRAGLLDEMRKLVAEGYKEDDPGMNSVGYREFFPYLRNEVSLEDSIRVIKKNTRRYAKRQLTWYRKIDFDLTYIKSNIIFSEVLKQIKSKIPINIQE